MLVKRRKKKIETSKKLLIYSDGLMTVVCIFAIIISFVCHDTSPFSYLIPAVAGLSTASHGFYYWKAKNENIQKYGNNINNNSGGDNYG